MTKTTHVLYLHGFRSSPQSTKALLVGQRVQQQHPQVQWTCPQLPPSPAEAAHLMQSLTHQWPTTTTVVIGSSLGGFYARWLALRRGLRAMLLNPAPHPARDLARHIGEQSAWHDPTERFFFQPHFIEELGKLELEIEQLRQQSRTTPDTLMALIAKGDEVLDWREMQAFCWGGQVHVLPGGDHAISDFEQHLDRVFGFLDPV